MFFEFDERQQRLRKASRKFLEGSSPITRVRELFDHPSGFDRDSWNKAASLGWFGMLVPEQYGGFTLTSQPLVDLVVVSEELGRVVQPGPFGPTNVVAHAIAQFGTDEQKERYLLSIASGQVIATWCIAEPGSRWRAEDSAVTVEATGDGFVLNGTKILVQDAEAADLLLVTARTTAGAVQLLVPARPRGASIWPRNGIDLTRRLYDVHFDNVVVPQSARLGAHVGAADEQVEEQLRVAKVLQCAESVGGATRLVELCVAYAKDRVQFGRPIGSFQAMKHKIADLHVAAESAAAATHYAALAVADKRADAAVAVDVAEIFVNDAYARIASEAIQVHGCTGFTWDSDIHLYLRRAKSNQALLGDADAHREHLCHAVAAGLS
ncbi:MULTISPECIES: acyl-CoA dehydrogenase family protein [Mycobacterium]|uniref:acyl-CoA dehydrogenase family protein n=1 Tax=Mycobacterium TaxID=1763 RepID=UPI00200F930A|nr:MULTISPECIES: acyl-CoA dehydrogenase family protein [Mycobacterium]UQB93116.1 acyl-CoA/acyl-ACP dehydrogenase [Mycobacterium intracellulare]WSE46167.1 acyl-CoA dehydrogenase family protein [Mycobacterium sp. 3-98]